MKGTYLNLLQKSKDSTSESAAHQKQEFKVVFFRKIGFFVTPIFLWMDITANQITILGLLLGIVASLSIWTGYLFTGIVIYFFVILLDHVDGTVARVREEATFYGRFIDGFSGIVVTAVIRLSISALIIENYGINWLGWLGIISTVLIPAHFLYYDRYSAFSRWINEENEDLYVKPYLRAEMPLYFNKIEDLQTLLLFCLPLYFYKTDFNYILLSMFFILNIFLALYTFFTYTASAYSNFNIKAKPHR